MCDAGLLHTGHSLRSGPHGCLVGGGSTSERNPGPLCRRHHRAKHRRERQTSHGRGGLAAAVGGPAWNWDLEQPESGNLTWRTPTDDRLHARLDDYRDY
ncbi:hypothetical protein FAIPA1_110094 [Frankia sp. AiPs1]